MGRSQRVRRQVNHAARLLRDKRAVDAVAGALAVVWVVGCTLAVGVFHILDRDASLLSLGTGLIVIGCAVWIVDSHAIDRQRQR